MNWSLKGSLTNLKWFFNGIAVKNPLGIFIFKKLDYINISLIFSVAIYSLSIKGHECKTRCILTGLT